ncbi:MAG TPA: GNAT family N-acetyltransferase [Micromonosporaceae bacterium]
MQVEVRNNSDEQRFEAWVDGALVGFAEYRRRPDVVVFIHTEVDPEYQGRGVAARLAAGALDQVRSAGDKIIVQCPYIARYLRRHPDQQDLVQAGGGARG